MKQRSCQTIEVENNQSHFFYFFGEKSFTQMYFVVHYDLVIRTDPRAIGRFKLFTISSYYSHDCFDQNTFRVFLSVITQI